MHHIGTFGASFTVIIMFFFSLSTILAVIYYGKSALRFINESTKLHSIYQVVVLIMIYVGGIKQNIFVWSLADFGLGIMTLINILCIIPISKPAIDALFSYEKTLK